jgi:hypothetical protein
MFSGRRTPLKRGPPPYVIGVPCSVRTGTQEANKFRERLVGAVLWEISPCSFLPPVIKHAYVHLKTLLGSEFVVR